jgi:hypothetical protein
VIICPWTPAIKKYHRYERKEKWKEASETENVEGGEKFNWNKFPE